MSGLDAFRLDAGDTLRLVGPTFAEEMAAELQPGGRYEAAGEMVRHYQAEIQRYTAAGVPYEHLLQLDQARHDVLAMVTKLHEPIYLSTPRRYVVEKKAE